MAQRFIVMKYKSILPTCMIPEPGDPMGADSYAYTSLKYTYTSLKYAGVVAEPLTCQILRPRIHATVLRPEPAQSVVDWTLHPRQVSCPNWMRRACDRARGRTRCRAT